MAVKQASVKAIISHDVDHITVWEHKRDMIVPKFIVRSVLELSKGYISVAETLYRFESLMKNKWHNIDALMAFDRESRVPSTFFVSVDQGRKLCYSLDQAQWCINSIKQHSFDLGVHGIAFDDCDKMKSEHQSFKKMSEYHRFGIRTHYAMLAPKSLEYMNKCGYLFDSSLLEFRDPFKIGNLWEFPLHIMDGYFVNAHSGRQKRTLEAVIKLSQNTIDEALVRKIRYLTILFHDRYFSSAFLTWKSWYTWLVAYLKKREIEFISYNGAIAELEGT